MRTFDGIRAIFTAIAGYMGASRLASRFTCGDCERNERCSLPPDDNCIAKAEQISRGDENRRRAPAG